MQNFTRSAVMKDKVSCDSTYNTTIYRSSSQMKQHACLTNSENHGVMKSSGILIHNDMLYKVKTYDLVSKISRDSRL